MLARVGRECDIVCIPTTDGDIPALRITYCEGHRVKLLRLKYEDTKRSLNAANEKYADACDTIVNLRLEIAELKGVNAKPNSVLGQTEPSHKSCN